MLVFKLQVLVYIVCNVALIQNFFLMKLILSCIPHTMATVNSSPAGLCLKHTSNGIIIMAAVIFSLYTEL